MGALVYSEKYSYSDYIAWNGDWELIYGAPYAMSPSPVVTHQSIMGKIYRALDEAFDNCSNCMAMAEMDWNVSDDTVVRPDVMALCDQEGERVVKSPEIVFEVISKSSAKRDEILKFELYKDEGVKYYCIVYPDMKKAKLYKLENDKYVKVADFTSDVYIFNIKYCDVEFDFGRIWRR